ncbi:MAG: hypothetical protein E7328_04995 [Clostridiales bacterium]|nr:hypothetical protein [Clostridiales bacterium]
MALFLIAAAMIVILLCRIRIEYNFYYLKGVRQHDVTVRLFCFYKKIDLLGPKAKRRAPFTGLELLKHQKDTLLKVLRWLDVEQFEGKLILGCEDAFALAMAIGVVQSAVYGLMAPIHIGKKDVLLKGIRIKPVFNREHFEASIRCIVKISLVNTIYAAFLLLKRKYQRSNHHAPN